MYQLCSFEFELLGCPHTMSSSSMGSPASAIIIVVQFLVAMLSPVVVLARFEGVSIGEVDLRLPIVAVGRRQERIVVSNNECWQQLPKYVYIA